MKRPEPFTIPVVLCPDCGHGIDPHSPCGDVCGVGDENGVPCDCRWSPNDIAGMLIEQARADEREHLRTSVANMWGRSSEWDDAIEAVLHQMDALLGGESE